MHRNIKFLLLYPLLLSLLFTWFCFPVISQTVVTEIQIAPEPGNGIHPSDIAVNSTTNRIYILNATNISVIDSNTNKVIDTITPQFQVPGLTLLRGIVTNPTTNRIYVTYQGGGRGKTKQDGVKVIDGETNRVIHTIPLGRNVNFSGLAINTKTNRIYVSEDIKIAVTVIDGNSNRIIDKIRVFVAGQIVVNPVTNTVYVRSNRGITVIDGTTNKVRGLIKSTNFPGIGLGNRMGINTVTNRLYVNSSNNSISTIDGNTSEIIDNVALDSVNGGVSRISVNSETNLIYILRIGEPILSVSVMDGNINQIIATVDNVSQGFIQPIGLGVDPSTNTIYATNSSDHTVSVIDGKTNQVVDEVRVGAFPGTIAVNPTTNTIYTNNTSRSMSIIDGETNQIVGNIKSFIDNFAVNPVSNLIYVLAGSKITIIDGITNAIVSNIEVRTLSDITINSVTNRIYFTSTAGESFRTIFVLDGTSNQIIDDIEIESNILDLKVNRSTNKIYMVNSVSDTVKVIDGETNEIIKDIKAGTAPRSIGINPETNMIYIGTSVPVGLSPDSSLRQGFINVINGNTDSVIANFPLFDPPADIDNFDNAIGMGIDIDNIDRSIDIDNIVVNTTTNHIYVTSRRSRDIIVIDGNTNQIIDKIQFENVPGGLSVNPTTNRIYITDPTAGKITVIQDQ